MNLELEQRQQIEREYHNRKFSNDYTPKYSSIADSSYAYFQKMISQFAIGKVLDFGCGDGWASIMMAQKGYDVFGIDISIELINKARKWAEEMGLSQNTHFEEVAGESLKFPDNYFDSVFGSAVLHHTDFELALNGIHRVLKPGGRAIFIEPMNQNILLKIWRALTPWRRSPTEKSLTVREINMILNKFPAARFKYFYFTSIITLGLITIFPNNNCFVRFNCMLEKLDDLLITNFPKLARNSAVVVFELIKGEIPTNMAV